MKYRVVHDDKHNYWYRNTEETVLSVSDFNVLIDNDINRVLFNLMKNDEIVKYIRLKDCILKEMISIITNNKDTKEIITFLSENNIPFFSLVMNTIDTYKRRYQYLCDFYSAKEVTISYTEDNISNAILLAKYLKCNVILDNVNISLDKYKEILDKYFTNDMDRSNIRFYFQENNSPLSAKELYNTSLMVNDIVSRVKKANLSQMESIMYVYDILKERIYKNDDENYHNARDVMNVLAGDNIVCVGYSNVFNAVLKCMDIKTMPLISYEANHQRSIAYVKDDKYAIDGVYVFDPTWDSKKDTNDYAYINRYNYFAMTLAHSNISAPDNFFESINISFDTLIDYYQNIADEDKLEVITNFDKAFQFISGNTFTNMESDLCNLTETSIKDKLENEYYSVKEKYNVSCLDEKKFTEILYNTRKAEKKDNLVSNINIDIIKKTIIDRYNRIKIIELKNKNYDINNIKLRFLLYSLDLKEKIDKYINYLIFNDIPLNKNLSKNIKIKKKYK